MHTMPNPAYRGRIAPSPTGLLHLGHAKTFWTAFSRCRNAGGKLIYRDEDIDFDRCTAEFSQAAVEDLQRLGIQWDEGPVRQSDRMAIYIEMLEKLASDGRIYPCTLSRKEIAAAPDTCVSPQGEPIFPASLRPRLGQKTHPPPLNMRINWRFRVPVGQTVAFEDILQGPKSYTGGSDFGDFLVWRKDGMPAYELAVVVDDAAMAITEVVRGADLLVSTARQLLLYEALEFVPPAFYHEHLVKDESGRRLAKSNNSYGLRSLFAEGHNLDSLRELWTKES